MKPEISRFLGKLVKAEIISKMKYEEFKKFIDKFENIKTIQELDFDTKEIVYTAIKQVKETYNIDLIIS